MDIFLNEVDLPSLALGLGDKERDPDVTVPSTRTTELLFVNYYKMRLRRFGGKYGYTA